MNPGTGDIWLADIGAEQRRAVYVVSDERFNRLAERAIVAQVLSRPSDRTTPPWWIAHGESVIALDRLSSLSVERLLERRERADNTTVRAVQRAIARLAAGGP